MARGRAETTPIARKLALRYSEDVQSIRLRSGDDLVLSPEQEWLFEVSGLIILRCGRVHLGANYDEMQLRTLVESTAGGLVCSFCASPKPRWRYPSAKKADPDPEAFVLPGHQLGVSHNEWLACEWCAELIARTDRDTLVRVSTGSSFPTTVVPDPDVRDAVEGVIRIIQDEFWRSRCGAPEEVPPFPKLSASR
jgi:hypothetical protein